MKIMIVLAVLIFAAGAQAQSAKVIQLSPQEAKLAKEKWDAMKAAQDDWDAFHAKITEKYLKVPIGDKDAVYYEIANGTGKTDRVGWAGGFNFSEDFKFIVPLVGTGSVASQPNWSWQSWPCGGVIVPSNSVQP